jgi:hypothetical protein
MSILQRLPFVSLGLLLLTYTTLGWVISAAYAPWFVWLVVAIAIFALVGCLTISWTRLTDYSFVFFKSNLRSFGLSFLGAFLFFLVIAKFRVFLDTLVIFAATILARIDFQTAGFTQGQAFWLISIFSLTGLAVGALINQVI